MVVFYYEPNKVRYISKINGNTIPLGSAWLTVVRKRSVLNWRQHCQVRLSFQNLNYYFDIVFASFGTSYQALC